MKTLKIGKAEGDDQIAPELIKYGGRKVIVELWKLFKQAWEEESIPEDWKHNIIVPIHKKGNSTECSNYRAICLAQVTLKIYTKILERKIRKVTENNMQEEQAAFRSQRQTQDHIFTLRQTTEKLLEYQREAYVAFLDLTAAFDNVNREEIWKAQEERKVPWKLRKVTRSVFQEVKGKIRINGHKSETFNIDKGLKQGDSLSPLLFILLMDKIIKECNNKSDLNEQKLATGI